MFTRSLELQEHGEGGIDTPAELPHVGVEWLPAAAAKSVKTLLQRYIKASLRHRNGSKSGQSHRQQALLAASAALVRLMPTLCH